MDLMRIDIFCADVGEVFFFPPYYLKNETGTFGMKMNIALQENDKCSETLKEDCDIIYRFPNVWNLVE